MDDDFFLPTPIKQKKEDEERKVDVPIEQSCIRNNNPIPELKKSKLSDEEADFIRKKWESRNYNDFNAWVQKTQSVLLISVDEIVKSTKFRTKLNLTNSKGLFEGVLYSEGDGYSKKESKANALKIMTNILIDKNLVCIEQSRTNNSLIVNESQDRKIKNLVKLISSVSFSNENECLKGFEELYKIKQGTITWNEICGFWYYSIQNGKHFLIKEVIKILFENPKNINIQIKDEMINSLIFATLPIQSWDVLNEILSIYFELISYTDDGIVSEMYYKHFKRIYHIELLENLQLLVHNVINGQGKSSSSIVSYGTVVSNGARFSQELINFTPDLNENIFTKSASSKERTISEDEILLIEGKNYKYIGVVTAIQFNNEKITVKIRKCFPYENSNQQLNLLEILNENSKETYKITKLMNIFVYNKTFLGLKSFCLSSSSILKQISTSSNGNVFQVNPEIRNIITSSYDRTLSLEAIDTLCNDTVNQLPTDFKVKNYLLNESQQEAIISSLSKRLTIIQGPPGTGKTSTCVEIVLEWLRLHPYELLMSKILVTAESNCAVDILYRELQIANVSAFRYSFKENMNMDYASIKSKINNARVICATCVGSANDYLKSFQFPFVIIDESTQATELSTLIPLLRNCTQLTLIGDHKQLPPTILSPIANKQGLGVSLFERLINLGIKPKLLNRQYRMHSSLYEFPSKVFYDGNILNGIEDIARPPIIGINWPNEDYRLGFVDIKGREEIEGNSFSYYNTMEINYIVNLTVNVLNMNANSPISIGIITPYDAQKRMIKKSIMSLYAELPESVVIVDTVDGFQGMERDLIIVSFVRSNDDGKIGFVNDARRINVILTRARRGLVVLGNADCMKGNKYWRRWLTFVDDNKLSIK